RVADRRCASGGDAGGGESQGGAEGVLRRGSGAVGGSGDGRERCGGAGEGAGPARGERVRGARGGCDFVQAFGMKRSLLLAMTSDLAFRTGIAALLGLVAAAGNLIGGYFVVRKEWPRQFLQYFLALGAGYMLAVAFVEVIPESVRLSGESALLYVLIGYFIIHLFEHTIAPHFH